MNLTPLRTSLIVQHHHQPQVVRVIEHSIRELEEALGRLAAVGHLFHLAEGPQPPADEWPRVMFHVDSAPNGRVVNSEWDFRDLGGEAEGWHTTLAGAQHADGVKTQFAGRGGVGVRSLPVRVNGGAAGRDLAAEAEARQRTIEQWKLQRSQNNGPE
jgi:hypothetical protein